MKPSFEVICLESEAFYALVNEVVERIKATPNIKEDKWMSTNDAMALLGIKSKTTLQKLRDEGRIRHSKATSRNILYDRESIMGFLDKKAEDTI